MTDRADASDQKRPTESLGAYQVPPETMRRLAELQQAVRDYSQIPPSKALLLSALIYGAPTDGEQLSVDVLAPYLRDHPDEERPR
jgi:hypothetical protein